jgi:PleD family two-component response regulator
MLCDKGSLLARSLAHRPSIPCLLTLEEHERKFAFDFLELGAYDFILKPLKYGQVADSLRAALDLYKWCAIIANKENVLERLRHRLDNYRQRNTGPLSERVARLVDDSIRTIELSTDSLKRSAEQIRRTLEVLKYACVENESQARHRALQRLETTSLE